MRCRRGRGGGGIGRRRDAQASAGVRGATREGDRRGGEVDGQSTRRQRTGHEE